MPVKPSLLPFLRRGLLLTVGMISAWSLAAPLKAEQYTWSVQYLIDQSQTVFGRAQTVAPRNNRGLALSPDRKYLYAAYIWTFRRPGFWDSKGEVRKIDLSVADYENATVALLPGAIAKALTVDPDGRVYAAMGTQVTVYDPDLAHELFVIPTSSCDGVAVVQNGSELVLYASERDRHSLKRFEIQPDSNGGISKVKQAGFDGGTGEISIPGSQSLRGIAVDTRGRIWLTDVKGNQLFRVEANGKDLKSIKLDAPIAVAFDGARGYVSLSDSREVAVIDDEMNVAGSVAVPWKELELSVFGNNHEGILAGIVVDPGKGFWVANAHGQTANQRSTYGRVDQFSDVINGKLYTDSFVDDNDPILHAVATISAPEEPVSNPATTVPGPTRKLPSAADSGAPGLPRGLK